MTAFASLAELRDACTDLPKAHPAAAERVASREALLTKPPGSLGRLEDMVGWLALWQGRHPPVTGWTASISPVFCRQSARGDGAGHPWPIRPKVTAQMVANFNAGGAAINQLAKTAGANLRVIALSLDQPTHDFTVAPAMDEAAFLAAVVTGADAVSPDTDLICLGEMGIGNTTAAAAIAAALFGGGGAHWAGRGTGVDQAGLTRKQAVIDRALAHHAAVLDDPLMIAAVLGGRELAAILGAALAARRRCIPVLLDGFVSTAAVAPLARLHSDAIRHALAAHVSAEAGHGILLEALGLAPLLDLKMRLGEGSGAAVAVLLMRAALACHTGMATFAEAQVSNKADNAHGAGAKTRSES